MKLREVNWRFTMYFAALVGGIQWAILAAVAVTGQNGTGATEFSISAGSWWLIIATSLAFLLIGLLLSGIARSIALRSTGLGLVICAASGWVMIAWIAIQLSIGG